MRFAWLVCLLDTYRKRMIIVIIFFLSFHQLQEHINLPLRSTADVLLRFPPGKFSLCSTQRKDIAQEIIRRDSQNREDIWRTWALLLFVWRMVKAISLIINLENTTSAYSFRKKAGREAVLFLSWVSWSLPASMEKKPRLKNRKKKKKKKTKHFPRGPPIVERMNLSLLSRESSESGVAIFRRYYFVIIKFYWLYMPGWLGNNWSVCFYVFSPSLSECFTIPAFFVVTQVLAVSSI